MTCPLAGRHALVTGGGSGIGWAVVDAYVAAGACVTVVEVSPENVARLQGAYGADVNVVGGSALDAATVEAAVALATSDGKLDNLTCCVGVFDYHASIRTMSLDSLAAAASEIWTNNVGSVLLAASCAYEGLRQARGSLTVTLSESAFRAGGGGVLYGSSKWALRGVVAHLAADFAPEIRVNGVSPGGTSGTKLRGLHALNQGQTADTVAGRDERIRSSNALHVVATPADHAGAYVFLADPVASGLCTGVVIRTDGGSL